MAHNAWPAPFPLPVYKPEQTVRLSSDIFTVWRSEISFLEDEAFVATWNKVIESAQPYIRDPNLGKVFWRGHLAHSLFVNSYRSNQCYVECGVHLGVISRTVFGMTTDKKYDKFLFDTWQGVPVDHFSPDDEKAALKLNERIFSEDTYEAAQMLFSEFSDVNLIRGPVPDTLGKEGDVSPCFLHVDMNQEYAERKALEYFVPKMRSGNVVLLDDYGFRGHGKQRKMADEFFAGIGKIPTQVPTGQAFVVL